jgi:leader peptidase (prepilin peptidase)/N-methyltransferase
LVTSLLLALVMVRFGLSWELPAYLYLVVISVVLAIVDATERRLPNAIVHPSLLVMPALLMIAAAVTGAWLALLSALLGGLGLFLFYLLLALVSPGGIGMGDVKLAGVLGFALGYLGWTTLLVGAMAGFIIGGLVSLGALAARRVKLSGSLPFGPSMLAGTFLALLIS